MSKLKVASVLITGALLVSCSSADGSGLTNETTSPATTTLVDADAAEADSAQGCPAANAFPADFLGDRDLPTSLTDLASRSEIVVLARTTGSVRQMQVADTLTPAHEFEVVESLVGRAPLTVEVVVGWAAYDYASGEAVEVPIFVDCLEYILYLSPLDFNDGTDRAEFVTVAGPAGVFVRPMNSESNDFVAVDGEFPVGRVVTIDAVVRTG